MLMFWIHRSAGRADRLAVHADVRHVAARAHQFGAHVEGRGHADGLDRDVDAVAVGQREHLLLPVGGSGVDAVRGADLLGHVQPVLVEVDRDDLGRAVQTGGGDDGEADRAGADDGDGVAGLDPAVLDAHLEAGREDVGQQQRGLVGDAAPAAGRASCRRTGCGPSRPACRR